MTEGKDEFLGRPLEDLEVSEEIVSTLYAIVFLVALSRSAETSLDSPVLARPRLH